MIYLIMLQVLSIIYLPKQEQPNSLTERIKLVGNIDTLVMNAVNNDKHYPKMNMEEREMLYWVNLCRKEPKYFWDSIIAQKYLPKGWDKNPYFTTLKRDLYKAKDLKLLSTQDSLLNAARFHANDLNNNRKFGHNSTDGTDCFERLNHFGIIYCAGENISLGHISMLDALIVLLVDVNVQDLGHRLNILSEDFDRIGLSCIPTTQPGYRGYLIVQDFGCQL